MEQSWITDILMRLADTYQTPVEKIRSEMEEYLEEYFSSDQEEARRLRVIFGGKVPGVEEYIRYLTDKAVLENDKRMACDQS